MVDQADLGCPSLVLDNLQAVRKGAVYRQKPKGQVTVFALQAARSLYQGAIIA